MTQQYLAGELSVLLAQLSTVATSQASYADAARLRHIAETVPPPALSAVVARALEYVDSLCWESLQSGSVTAFTDQAVLGAQLREFGVCARLLDDG